MKRLLIVTDAWYPQINGVVRTLSQVRDGLIARGWDVTVLGPSGTTMACPTYGEIRLTLWPTEAILEELARATPDCIHIATEGPLGWAMRRMCKENGWQFTTSFHTRFPEYLKARLGLPRRWTYQYLRSFHAASSRVLAPTKSIVEELRQRGFNKVSEWGRGVDTVHFTPAKRKTLPYPGPIFLYVGRLAVEKNVEAFLSADMGQGTKIVVGDGPARKSLESRFPGAVFLGSLMGDELAAIYASSDVFVFPSKTDTFGLVILEALASGLPVVAYPVPGPIDVLGNSPVGILSDNLGEAAQRALTIDRQSCRDFAERHSWSNSLDQFESSLEIEARVSVKNKFYFSFQHKASENL